LKLAYDESAEALNIRIRAHKRYSSLRIEDELEAFLRRHPSNRILDVGCGTGNYSDIFARHCLLYVGLDKNNELLIQALQKSQSNGLTNTLFLRGDMNESFLFLSGSFDLVFFGYSAYYADDVVSLIRRSKNVLAEGGVLCLVGPLAGNGIELDLVSQALFGIPSSAEKEARISRLQKEFLPVINVEFRSCQVSERDFSLIFPSSAEYTEYYLATPQYMELAERFDHPQIEMVQAAIAQLTRLELTKKALFVWAYK
jgi:SAM-dependent methyltransferase